MWAGEMDGCAHRISKATGQAAGAARSESSSTAEPRIPSLAHNSHHAPGSPCPSASPVDQLHQRLLIRVLDEHRVVLHVAVVADPPHRGQVLLHLLLVGLA